MNKDLYFIARDGFVVRDIMGETVLVPVDTNNIYAEDMKTQFPEFNGIIHMNEVSLFLWNKLSEPATLPQLVDYVCSEFEVTDEDVESDVKEFLAVGLKNRIIFILADNPENL